MKWFGTLKIRLINWVFNREFRYFVYPFESLDSIIYSMSKDDRNYYQLEARRTYRSKMWRMEMTELKKLFYKELALNSQSDIDRAGYRLALLFMRKLERRIKFLTDQSYLNK
jgi:hypothetical protein